MADNCPTRAAHNATILRLVDQSLALTTDQAIRDWISQFDRQARQVQVHVGKCEKCKNGVSSDKS